VPVSRIDVFYTPVCVETIRFVYAPKISVLSFEIYFDHKFSFRLKELITLSPSVS